MGQGCGSQTPIDDNDTLVVCDGGAVYTVGAKTKLTGTAPGPLLAANAPDGGVWLYSQTTPVQVGDLDAGFSVISGTQPPVWGSPLGGNLPATYALGNSGEVVLLQRFEEPDAGSAQPRSRSGAGVVDPTIGTSFVGAVSKASSGSARRWRRPPALSCAKLCAAADTVVELEFQVVMPAAPARRPLDPLAAASLPAGTDLAVVAPPAFRTSHTSAAGRSRSSPESSAIPRRRARWSTSPSPTRPPQKRS